MVKKAFILSRKFFFKQNNDVIKITVEGDDREVEMLINLLKKSYGYYIREVSPSL